MIITQRSTLVVLKPTFLCAMWLLFASCGGGSGDPGVSVPPPIPPPPPSTQVNAEGIWSGTAIVRCDITTVRAFITREGFLFVDTPAGTYVGSVTEGPRYLPPDDVTAVNYRIVQDTPLAMVAQPDADPLEITYVDPGIRLRVQWAPVAANFCSPNDSDLQYDDHFERPASLAIIAGVYTDGSVSIAVNSDGVVNGSDMDGCVLNGTVAVIHADRNYYSTTMDVDNCAASGTYEGAAFIEDAAEGGQDNELVLAVANSQHAIWLTLVK